MRSRWRRLRAGSGAEKPGGGTSSPQSGTPDSRRRRTSAVMDGTLGPDAALLLAAAHDELVLEVDCLATLLALAVVTDGGSARQLTVHLATWPRRGPMLPVPGPVRGLREQRVSVRGGRLRVDLVAKQPLDLGELLSAVLAAVLPVPRSASTGAEVALARPAPPSCAGLVGAVHRLVTLDHEDPAQVRPTDLLLTAAPGRPADVAELVVDAADVLRTAAVDPVLHRPVGRSAASAHVTGQFDGATLRLLAADGTARRELRGDLTDLDVQALREVASCTVAGGPATAAQARQLVQLSASGVVVHVPEHAAQERDRAAELAVDPVVRGLWADAVPSDPVDLEVASVRQRRAAHLAHGARRVVARLLPGTVSGTAGDAPEVTVLLCTNRASHLREAISGLVAMDLPRVQVVLGLHGVPAPPELVDWLAPLRAKAEVVCHQAPPGTAFGAVLAQLSARADGELLAKLDDDDRYGRNHLVDLVVAREYSGAVVVGKGAEFVHFADRDVTVRRGGIVPEKYGRTVAGGTMLIARADLAAVGGWRPVPRSVDRALLDRVLRAGGSVYRTHGLGYVYVRRESDDHTWTVEEEHFTTQVVERRDGCWLVDP